MSTEVAAVVAGAAAAVVAAANPTAAVEISAADSFSGWDLAEWLERQSDSHAEVLGSLPASSDTVESEGWQMKQCWIKYLKIQKNLPVKKKNIFSYDTLYVSNYIWKPL